MLATQVFLDTYATEGIRPDIAAEVIEGYGPEAFASRLQDRHTRILLAERTGHLVGFAEVTVQRRCPNASVEDTVELVRLYVQQPFQRTGIGSALLEQAEQLAVQEGAKAMWLTAWSGNARALDFYRARGYRDLGATQYYIQGNAYENRVLARSIMLRAEVP